MFTDRYTEIDTSSMADDAEEVQDDLSSSKMVASQYDPDYSIRASLSMALSDEDESRLSSEDDSDAPIATQNQLPGIAHFSLDVLFEGM
jgi:hypothetical protein